MCVVYIYVVCYFFRFFFICGFVFIMKFMARLVGRGRFVFGCEVRTWFNVVV